MSDEPVPFARPDVPAEPPTQAQVPPVRGRRRKPAEPDPRKVRRRIGFAMLAVGGLIMLAGAWLVVTGLLARSQLQSVRTEVHQLRAQLTSGDLGAARKTLSSLQTHAKRAHQLTSGPVWALAAELPAGGEPIDTVRGITSGADKLAAKALPTLIDVRDKLEPGKLRDAQGRVDIATISAVRPSLDRADAVISSATAEVGSLPRSTWLSPVDRARSDLFTQMQGLATDVRAADLTVHVAPPMLGATGTKRYFVGFQNEAEARGLGGLPGAFGILDVTNGKPHFERFENDSYLGHVDTGLSFGADYDQLYAGDETTSLYVNSNLSPNFPYAARVWTTMWQKVTGQHLDGAIALDPTTLSYLLAVTGPAQLPHQAVDAGNVVALTQSTVYSQFGQDVAGRKAFLLAVAKSASTRIVDSRGSTRDLLKAAGKAVGQRRLLIWSADPAVQADLARTTAAGVIPDSSRPYAGAVVVNAPGNKLDYYLDRSFTWQRTGCGSQRSVTATVTLTNTAPAAGLPSYVTHRGDRHSYPVRPGDTRVDLEYYATQGAQLQSVTLDGKPATAGSGIERGHPVLTTDVELPRGVTRTIVFHLTEPAGKGTPRVLRQPLVRSMNVTIDDAKCD